MRDELLNTLADGAWHSGQELADRAGITRAAIWKSIEGLRKDGYLIEAQPRRGYRLAEAIDILNETALRMFLPEEMQENLRFYEEIDSTNDQAVILAQQGAPAGTVVIAGMQLVGKGRRGRSFFSPKNSGLYVSLVLRPLLPAQEAVLMTLAAAVAVAETAEAFGSSSIEIKWVNDIYREGRKCAGILTEANLSIEDGGLDWAVVGIGINMYQAKDIPEDIQDRFGALFERPGAEPFLRARFASSVLKRLWQLSKDLNARHFLEDYRARLLYQNQMVYLIQGNQTRKVKALDIDAQGALIVENEEGKIEHISSGEVSLRPMD